MAENGLSERVERIEQKLDTQFTEVQEHFVEQRRYIEFAYDKLDKRVDGLGKRMTDGFVRLDERSDGLDQRMTDGFARLDQRSDGLGQRMTDGFSRLERKFDQFIAAPSRPTSARRRPARPTKRRR